MDSPKINILYHAFLHPISKLGYLCEPQVKNAMQNVLKNGILILLLVLTGSIVIPVKGQNISLQEVRIERTSSRSEISKTPSIPLILLLNQNCELPIGISSIGGDSKILPHLSILQRNNKNNEVQSNNLIHNLYFHPFSTLEKTKYYVFALREIIV